MRDIKPRLEKIEKQMGSTVAPGEIDWPALLARVAKHGKRLIYPERFN